MSKIGWWKFGQDSELVDELGSGLTFAWTGTKSYQDGKFAKGVYSNSNSNWIATSNILPGWNSDNLVVDIWLKMDMNIVNGVPAGSGFHSVFNWDYNNQNRIIFHFSPSGFNMGIKVSNIWYDFYVTNFSVTAGKLFHLGLVYKRAGIAGGSDVRRCYFNGNLVASSTIIPPSQTLGPGFYRILGIALAYKLDGVADDLVLYNDEKIDFSDRIYEGRVVPIPALEEITYEKKNPKVLILGDEIDIYDEGYVDKILNVTEKKTFRKDKLIVNQIKQTVSNKNNFFSVDNPESTFSNIRWRYDRFKIINQDGQKIWDGVIKDIERNHRSFKATIVSTDSLAQFQNRKIAYTSSGWETPAESFRNICDQEGFTDYNLREVNASIDRQTAAGCLVKCFFDLEDDITFQQAIEKLGEVGVADVYLHNNFIYYSHYVTFTGGVGINITQDKLRKQPVVTSNIRDLINDYSIRYNGDGGVPATDAANNNIGEVSRQDYGSLILQFDCSEKSQIVVKDKDAAVYIGEAYIKRTHIDLDTKPRPPQIIKISLPGNNKDYINLQTFFKLTFAPEDWNEKIFEVFENNIDHDNENIKITAYEVNA